MPKRKNLIAKSDGILQVRGTPVSDKYAAQDIAKIMELKQASIELFEGKDPHVAGRTATNEVHFILSAESVTYRIIRRKRGVITTSVIPLNTEGQPILEAATHSTLRYLQSPPQLSAPEPLPPEQSKKYIQKAHSIENVLRRLRK